MIRGEQIESIVEQYMQQCSGLYLLSAEVKLGNCIYVEIDHDHDPIGIDQIVDLTRFIEDHLDRDQEDFELEVSSAGLTTPLTTPRRYRKFLGKELEVLLKKGVKEVGTLVEVADAYFLLEVVRMVRPEGEKRKRPITEQMQIAYDEVKRASYLIKI